MHELPLRVVTALRERPLAGWLTKGIAGIFYQPPS